ncbi:hypothetical protein D8674_000412 [Pyrus ussuriensis x Pyrus communis]|uniref:Aminotransferase-like plant mobile domain-containing protein n=1 Tax=Pyrus ussuriensis x Pyrus communis TaxID=2448454 RepID=A0A5N5F8I0_9ROSA|nr:hypothetical protein D8674_000412 [Pyrus ussuriensis x Pyrus communis]
MEPHFSDEWKTFGIFDAIKLSTFEITMDRELLMAALSFWCLAINIMILHLDPIGPIVLDITTILGTSPSGHPIDATLSWYEFDLDLKVVFDERAIEVLSKKNQRLSKKDVQKLHKNFFNYSTLITHFAGSEREAFKKGEREAFLFYWYNKFVFCTKSSKCLAENMPVAETLASGHVLTLSSTIFANLDRCLAKASVYFPILRPAIPNFNSLEVKGLQLALILFLAHSTEGIFKYFFNLEYLSDNEFLICCRQKYPSSITLPTSAWEEAEDADL